MTEIGLRGLHHRYIFRSPYTQCRAQASAQPRKSWRLRCALNGINNEPLGIVTIQEALRLSGEADVDLVEIAATADPPVCRLMDYGKFKYQEQKKAAEAKAKQKVIEVKEVKFRPGTDDGDYNIKMRNLRRSSLPRMATRARSRCAFGAARSRTRIWACACWSEFAMNWPMWRWSSSFPSLRGAR